MHPVGQRHQAESSDEGAIAMSFCCEGWCCQLVIVSGALLLEACRDGEILTASLDPLDSPRARAFELVSHPCCDLATHGGYAQACHPAQ
jgi:hypothetical protein